MSLSRLLRTSVLCAALLVPALALAPLADARPANPASPTKKKCKKGFHRVKGKCKRNKKKPVGLGETTTTSTIGGAPSATSAGPLLDATGGIIVVGGLSSTAAGTVGSISYAASRAGTIRFLLLDATAKVKYTTADIAVSGAGLRSYVFPAPTLGSPAWRAVNGDRLAVWMGTPTAIGYSEISRTVLRPPPAVLVGTSTAPPAVGAVIAARALLPGRLYPFVATVADPKTTCQTRLC